MFFFKALLFKLGSSSANRDDNLEKVWNHHPVLYIHDIIHHYKTASKGTIVFKVSAYSIQSSLMSPFFSHRCQALWVKHRLNTGKDWCVYCPHKKCTRAPWRLKHFLKRKLNLNQPSIYRQYYWWLKSGDHQVVGSWPSHLQSFSTIPSAGFLNSRELHRVIHDEKAWIMLGDVTANRQLKLSYWTCKCHHETDTLA